MEPLKKISLDNVLLVIAALLGEEWEVIKPHNKLLHRDLKCSIYFDTESSPGRMIVAGSDYYRDKYGKMLSLNSYPHLKDFAESKYTEKISVSTDKNCFELLGEIKKRFIPNYLPVIERLYLKKGEIDANHEIEARAYKDFCHEASYYLDISKIKQPIEGFTIPGRGIYFKLSSDYTSLKQLTLTNISVEQGVKIMQILNE